MRTSIGNWFTGLACIVVLVGLTGCPQPAADKGNASGGGEHSDDHGDHGVPKTLGDVAETLEHLNEDIAAAFSKEDGDAAHGPLHEVADALDAGQMLLAKAELPDETKATVGESLEKIGELFGQVDAKMHGNEGADYKDVEAELQTTIAAFCAAVGADDHEDGHDEDGDDHEGEDKDGHDEDGDDHEGEDKDGHDEDKPEASDE